MKDGMKMILLWVAGLVTLIAIGWALAVNQVAMFKVFSPVMEQARRETFEQSKAYRDGAVQELRAMQFEYIKADSSHKAGLAAVIRHKSAGLPQDAIPADLNAFIKEIQ